jgi:hypothetical protein
MQPLPAEPTSDENRRALRRRCLLQGRCIFNKGYSDLNVLVRNISATGAKLTGDQLQFLPSQFELRIPNPSGGATTYLAKRVWSRPDSIGVAFIDPARDPSAAESGG